MKQAILFRTLFALTAATLIAACSKSSDGSATQTNPPNDPSVTIFGQAELPVRQDGVVGYAPKDGDELEAWEVDKENNRTYLNYSRFPFGTFEHGGKKVWLCVLKEGDQKYVGVADSSERLIGALYIVSGKPSTILTDVTCAEYEHALKKHPEFKSLRGVFETIN